MKLFNIRTHIVHYVYVWRFRYDFKLASSVNNSQKTRKNMIPYNMHIMRMNDTADRLADSHRLYSKMASIKIIIILLIFTLTYMSVSVCSFILFSFTHFFFK